MEHSCTDYGNQVYPIDSMLLCAGCYARYVLRTYGKEARFVSGVLVMMEYQDLTYLNPDHPALILRAELYKEYLGLK